MEEEREAMEKIDLSLKHQARIKHACDRLAARDHADGQVVGSFFVQLLNEMRSDIPDSSQFDDLYWLLAERIKGLIASKSANPSMSSMLCTIRDKMINIAPGRLEKAAKAFFSA